MGHPVRFTVYTGVRRIFLDAFTKVPSCAGRKAHDRTSISVSWPGPGVCVFCKSGEASNFNILIAAVIILITSWESEFR